MQTTELRDIAAALRTARANGEPIPAPTKTWPVTNPSTASFWGSITMANQASHIARETAAQDRAKLDDLQIEQELARQQLERSMWNRMVPLLRPVRARIAVVALLETLLVGFIFLRPWTQKYRLSSKRIFYRWAHRAWFLKIQMVASRCPLLWAGNNR